MCPTHREQVLPAQPGPEQAEAGLEQRLSHSGEHRYGGVPAAVEPHRGTWGSTPSLETGDMGGDGGERGPWALGNLFE